MRQKREDKYSDDDHYVQRKKKQTDKHKDKHIDKHKDKHKDKHNNYRKLLRSRSREKQINNQYPNEQRPPTRQRPQTQQKPNRPYIQTKPQQTTKQIPNFQPSGMLLTFYNSRQGVNLKFNQPPQSRPPSNIWRIYIFKGQQVLQPILLSNSSYLIGKDPMVSDSLCENPSISRQHAVVQFRIISKMNIDGTYQQLIKPYLMDLQSTNGTILNEQRIEGSRYVELLHRDVIKFGFSDREYVIVREGEGEGVNY